MTDDWWWRWAMSDERSVDLMIWWSDDCLMTWWLDDCILYTVYCITITHCVEYWILNIEYWMMNDDEQAMKNEEWKIDENEEKQNAIQQNTKTRSLCRCRYIHITYTCSTPYIITMMCQWSQKSTNTVLCTVYLCAVVQLVLCNKSWCHMYIIIHEWSCQPLYLTNKNQK
jgi:hypothetical protein